MFPLLNKKISHPTFKTVAVWVQLDKFVDAVFYFKINFLILLMYLICQQIK